MTHSKRPGTAVVGTAGHVDHGKSALIRALTGVDPDRLPEEKSRGMTIDLGFAALSLPSGARVGVVDVPGHERFVATMVVGISAIDIVLLVIAADEGVMPQTREHLAILDLLGVCKGLLVLTKIDLVDADLLELVRAEAVEMVQGTSLHRSEVVPVSSRTGEGLDKLKERLDRLLLETENDSDGVARLPVDRVFTARGFGTVVTGTLRGSGFELGQEVELMPSGARSRIRGIQSHGLAGSHAVSGSRVALNLARLDRHTVSRGEVVALPGTMRRTRRFVALVRLLPNSPMTIGPNAQLIVHAGAAEVGGRMIPLEGRALGPGESGWVRVRVDKPITVWRRQRLVFRLPSPARTVGGGEVADIAPLHRPEPNFSQRLFLQLSHQPEAVILATISARPRDAFGLATLTALPIVKVLQALDSLERDGEIVRLGSRYATSALSSLLRDRLVSAVESYHAEHPLRTNMPREQLRRKLGLEATAFRAILQAAVASGALISTDQGEGPLERDPGRPTSDGVATRDHGLTMMESLSTGGGREADRLEHFMRALKGFGLSPPSVSSLLADNALDVEILDYLQQTGRVVRIDDGLYLEASVYRGALDTVTRLLEVEKAVTVARMRDALGSSRKYVIALFEHLDAQQITKRVGDTRVPGRSLSANRV